MKRHSTVLRSKRVAGGQAAADGFTIVELMIATVIFSLVLLVITLGVLHFSNSYYKGINSSATQTAAQNAIDTISQAIQFSSAGTAGTDVAPAGVFCAGSRMFVYTLGVAYPGGTPTSSNWGLYMFPNPHTADCNDSDITDSSNGTELLGKNMRLTAVTVQNTNVSEGLWKVTVGIAYGDSDLLCDPSKGAAQGGCSPSALDYSATATVYGDNIECKLQTGSQFCSVAGLTTVAQQRVAGD